MEGIPSHRACAWCRNQKVRCIPDDHNQDVCQRCARSGRSCVFTPLQKRKQRKRTDTRVAELEREMRTMRQMLKQKEEEGKRADSEPGPDMQTQARRQNDTISPEHRRLSQADNPERRESIVPDPESSSAGPKSSAPSLWPKRLPDRPMEEDYKDVIDKGLINMATARQLLATYKQDLYPHYPLVYVPTAATVEELRKSQPTLFLAIIAAASSKENPDLSILLDHEVLQSYATRSLVQSQKSIELVQGLIISAVWYNPPSRFGQLKYYEYIHMAATMAMDIGIGSRQPANRGRYTRRAQPSALDPAEDVNKPDLSMTPRSRNSSPDPASIEARRTFLSCYFICAGVSLSLRRPNLLKASSYIRDCVDHLDRDNSPEIVPSDRTLVAWARLIMIAEEISTGFCLDDFGEIASITELRVQIMLKDYESRLTSWYRDMADEDFGPGSLMIMYHTVRLYLYEIALHVDHPPEDFRAPYQMGGIYLNEKADSIPTQILAEAVSECVQSSHALLDTFLAIDADSLRALPVFSFVRISFAAFVLAKLSLSAVHPRSRLSKVLDRSSLKAESYMDRSILHAKNIAGPNRSRVPSIFLALLFKLRQWCLYPCALINVCEENFQEMISRPQQHLAYEESRHPDRTTTERDGPRTTERSSSAHASPQTAAEAAAAPALSTDGPASRSTSNSRSAIGVTRSSQENLASNYLPGPNLEFHSIKPMTGGFGQMSVSAAAPPPAMGGFHAANPQSSPYGGMLDPMNLDDTLMSFIGDMNFPEGGLTGLDDWSIPPDLNGMNQMDVMNWQFPHPSGV